MAEYKIDINFNQNSLPSNNSDWRGNTFTQLEAIRKLAPVVAVTGISKNLVNWRISRVGRDMGSSITQQKIDIGMSLASQAMATGGLLLGGVATANPALIIAGISSGINTVINYAKDREQFNYNRGWENKALAYARERAGASFNRSRVDR